MNWFIEETELASLSVPIIIKSNVKSNDKILFIQLENQCLDSKEYRASLVDLAKKYRTFEKV